jgi:hypothetical protein
MLQLAVVAGGTAAALVGLLGLARRLRIRRMLNQLPVYTLGPNAAGVTVSITPVGASITRLSVPGAGGAPLDIVLGYERAASYALANSPYLGAVVGRCANRIAEGRFELDGREYRLAVNNGPNALHGACVWGGGWWEARERGWTRKGNSTPITQTPPARTRHAPPPSPHTPKKTQAAPAASTAACGKPSTSRCPAAAAASCARTAAARARRATRVQ